MGVSKVVLGEETLVDLTSDSVNEENLLEGATAHGADGEPVKGTVEIKPKTLTTTKAGEQIHLVDSTDNKVVEFALYGKAKQNTTNGKNLLMYPHYQTTKTANGITFTDVGDGSIVVNGTAESRTIFYCVWRTAELSIETEKEYILSCGSNLTSGVIFQIDTYKDNGSTYVSTITTGNGKINEKQFSLDNNIDGINVLIIVEQSTTVTNLVVKPMIRLASIEDDTWEPYTGGIPSPNPEYAQEIEVSGESYNLLENTANSTTVNGVKFVVNENDGSVMVNGTASAFTILSIKTRDEGFVLPKGKYVLSGCPKGGSLSSYFLRINQTIDGEGVDLATDLGNGIEFNVENDGNLGVFIAIPSNATVNNLIFKPMIRKASVKNDRYMPYGKGSVEVKNFGKNLLPYPYYQTTREESGISITDLGDGTLKVNGTATNLVLFFIRASTSGNFGLVNGKEYKLSGCPSGGSVSAYKLDIQNQTSVMAIDYGSGASFIYDEQNGGEIGQIRIVIYAGTKVDNLIFKPMIRLATDTDDTYEPYKETLSTIPTDGLAGIKVSSGGNYTDQNGQQWICDEIVKYSDGSGEYIKRITNITYNGGDIGCGYVGSVQGATETLTQMNLDNRNALYVDWESIICDKFKVVTYDSANVVAYTCRQGASTGSCVCYLPESEGVTDKATANAWLQENHVTVYFILKEPIRTPLTAEEIAEIEKLSTFYPVTNISNDFDCGMNVEYVLEKVITTQAPIPVIPSTEIEELKSGDTTLTLFGKIKKWLTSIKPHAFLNPVNNLLATVSGSSLDATQGKVLDDKINVLNNSLVADIYVGDDGKLHKVQGGADSVLPFSSGYKEMLVGSGGAIMFMVKDDYSMLYSNGTSDLVGDYIKCDYVSGYHANIYAIQDCTVLYKHNTNAIVEKDYSANELIVTVNYPSGNFCAFVK